MSPEIVRRRATDNRLDIFAFGITMYRFMTFEHPWRSTDTTGKAALAHNTSEVTPILKHRPNLNKTLAKAIHKCIEIVPDKRMPSAKQFLQTIRNVKQEDEV